MDFVWVNKKPHGKREFVYNGQEASNFNYGDYPIHTVNGNFGYIGHEDHDENISIVEARAAEMIADDFDTTDVKEIYQKIKQLEKTEDKVFDEAKDRKQKHIRFNPHPYRKED